MFAHQGFTVRLVNRAATIDAWYSEKHRDFGANIQAVMRPEGIPIWTSDAMPGHLHDLTCAQRLDVTGALYWTASELRLPTLADSGYEGTGQGNHTPCKQPPTAGASRSTTAPTTPPYD
ncbi:transposase family protein [Micromonospora sp. CNB394]|uniref:transposase family protein n=1 Tax=Micromonospora sp. CNB394 TaxID=1169151 RepID=UPI001E2AC135|nr:transposase family protein [Micromonospora sp. CNB394]